MEKTVKGIVAEQKQYSVVITNNQEEIHHLRTMVASQQADIDALKGKQKNSQNINFLRITGLICENKDVNTCFLHLAQEIDVESIKQTDFSARKLVLRQKQDQQRNSLKKKRQGHDLTSDPVTPNQNKTKWTNTSIVIVEFYNTWVRKQVYMQLRKISKGQGFLSLSSSHRKLVHFSSNADN